MTIKSAAEFWIPSTLTWSAPCAGDCGLCAACVRRLPVALVDLMAQSRGSVPAVFETAVRCAGMWLRANPQTVAAGILNEAQFVQDGNPDGDISWGAALRSAELLAAGHPVIREQDE